MKIIFLLLVVCGIVFETIGVVGIMREQIKDQKQPYAFKFLMVGFACHGFAFLISYI